MNKRLYYIGLEKPLDLKTQGQESFIKEKKDYLFVDEANLELIFLDPVELFDKTHVEIDFVLILLNRKLVKIDGYVEVKSGQIHHKSSDGVQFTNVNKTKCEFSIKQPKEVQRIYLTFQGKISTPVVIEAHLDKKFSYITSDKTIYKVETPKNQFIPDKNDLYHLQNSILRPKDAPAQIYFASDQSNQNVVIKQLNPYWFANDIEDEEEKEAMIIRNILRFFKEGSLLCLYDMPFLLKGKSFFTWGKNRYIVMEYIDGEALNSIIWQNYKKVKLFSLPKEIDNDLPEYIFSLSEEQLKELSREEKLELLKDVERQTECIKKLIPVFAENNYKLSIDTVILKSDQDVVVLRDNENYTTYHIARKKNEIEVSKFKYVVEVVRVLKYFFQILYALDLMHLDGIYHRDIKPQNIMVSYDKLYKYKDKEKQKNIINDGNAVLIDLGTIKDRDDEIMKDFLGTLSFIPPEYQERGIYNESSDLYSLAASIYVALTGRHSRTPEIFPSYFASCNDIEKIRKYRWKEAPKAWFKYNQECEYIYPESTGKYQTSLEDYVDEFLKRLLSYNPEDRIIGSGDSSRTNEELGSLIFSILRKIEDFTNPLYNKFYEKKISLAGPNREQISLGKHYSDLTAQAISDSGKEYVIKFANPELFSDKMELQEKFYHRFQLQMKILQKMYSENTAKIVFTCVDPDISYFIMEKIDGYTVEDLIEDSELKQNYQKLDVSFCRLIRDVASVLASLDSLNLYGKNTSIRWKFLTNFLKKPGSAIYHRNINPQNIIVGKNNSYLVGFGQVKDSLTGIINQGPSLGQIIKNYFFIAPENHKGVRYDVKSDIFSLGLVWHLLLTKEHPLYPEPLENEYFYPFPEDAVEQSKLVFGYKRILKNLPEKFSPHISLPQDKIKKNICELLASMLHWDPKERPTPKEVCRQLTKIINEKPKSFFKRFW